MSIADQVRMQALEAKSEDLLAKYLELAAKIEAFEKQHDEFKREEGRKTLHLKDKPRG